jgi:hypothetical protein
MPESTRSAASYSAQQLREHAQSLRRLIANDGINFVHLAADSAERVAGHIETVCAELHRTEETMRAGRKMREAIRVLINTLGDEEDDG